jgi:RHS repeat-associated protein
MPQVTLTNAHDGIGNRTSFSDNHGGQYTFAYDSILRMTRASMIVSGSTAAEATFTYDAASRLTLLSRTVPGYSGSPPMPNPKTDSTFAYDDADRLTGITHQHVPVFGSPTTLATYSYVYNAANELVSETHADGTFNYTYDLTGQLTAVDASGGTCGATACDESFGYDLNGNRAMSGYTTGAGNRLTSDGTYNYTYDDEGNTLTKTRISDSQKTEFTWDYRNRLTQVLIKNASGTILTQANYTYDAINRRIITTVDGDGAGPQSAKATATVYDALQPPTAAQLSSGAAAPYVDGVFESAAFSANPLFDFVDPDGPSGPQPSTLDARRLYGFAVDMILARRNGFGTVAWYLGDHLGSIRDVAGTSGAVIDHINYSVFGSVTAESSPSNGDRFKFTGREYEFEGYYLRARYYDSEIGRFRSVDPISFVGGSNNLFAYVMNSVTTATDRAGLSYFGCASYTCAPPETIPPMFPDDPPTPHRRSAPEIGPAESPTAGMPPIGVIKYPINYFRWELRRAQEEADRENRERGNRANIPPAVPGTKPHQPSTGRPGGPPPRGGPGGGSGPNPLPGGNSPFPGQSGPPRLPRGR